MLITEKVGGPVARDAERRENRSPGYPAVSIRAKAACRGSSSLRIYSSDKIVYLYLLRSRAITAAVGLALARAQSSTSPAFAAELDNLEVLWRQSADG